MLALSIRTGGLLLSSIIIAAYSSQRIRTPGKVRPGPIGTSIGPIALNPDAP